jgi:uncharacterized protein (DUF433 family)
MADAIRQHIKAIQGASGPTARIVGHRVRVLDVAVWHERWGMTPDEIVDQYPALTLADVHAALAYYRDHREEIEQAIVAGHLLAEEVRRRNRGPLRQALARRGHGLVGAPPA